MTLFEYGALLDPGNDLGNVVAEHLAHRVLGLHQFHKQALP